MTENYHVFYSRLPSCGTISPRGRKIQFVDSVYLTKNEEEIAFLTAEAKAGHPHIYIKAGAETVEKLEDVSRAPRKKSTQPRPPIDMELSKPSGIASTTKLSAILAGSNS